MLAQKEDEAEHLRQNDVRVLPWCKSFCSQDLILLQFGRFHEGIKRDARTGFG